MRISGNADEKRDWEAVNAVKRVLHSNNIHSTTIQLEHDDASLDSCNEHCPRHHNSHRKEKCCSDQPHEDPVSSQNETVAFIQH